MEVYPMIFPEHDTLSLYGTGETVNWRVFAGNLNGLFHSFLKLKRPPSCLGLSGPDHVPASFVDESRKGQVDVAALKDQLQFFIPVFIWNFNERKQDLTRLDWAIFKHRTLTLSKIEKGLRYYQPPREGHDSPMPPAPQIQPPNNENRFKLGTALNLRKYHPLPLNRDVASRGESGKDDEKQMGITPLFRHLETGWFFSDIANKRTQHHPHPSRVRGNESTPGPAAAPRGHANSRVRGRGSPRIRSPTLRSRAAVASVHTDLDSSSRAAGATRTDMTEGEYTYFCLERNISD